MIEELRSLAARFAAALFLVSLAVLALLGAAVWGAFALYFRLEEIMDAASAAAITGGVVLLLAAVLAGIACLVLRKSGSSGPKKPAVDPASGLPLGKNSPLKDLPLPGRPWERVYAGLIAGFCLGASPELRRSLSKIIEDYTRPPPS